MRISGWATRKSASAWITRPESGESSAEPNAKCKPSSGTISSPTRAAFTADGADEAASSGGRGSGSGAGVAAGPTVSELMVAGKLPFGGGGGARWATGT